MNPGAEDSQRDADEAVRSAVSASVALITRSTEKVDVPPTILLEGADPQLVAQVLAVMASILLENLLPDDSGRRLLIRIGRRAAEGGRP